VCVCVCVCEDKAGEGAGGGWEEEGAVGVSTKGGKEE